MASGDRIRSRLLTGPRLRLYELIRARPGSGFLDLGARVGVNGALQHHLALLERFGLVASEQVGPYRRYYVVGTLPLMERRRDAWSRNPRVAPLLEALRRHPGAAQNELAGILGVTHQAVSALLRPLTKCGLVLQQRMGRRIRYVAPENRPGPAIVPRQAPSHALNQSLRPSTVAALEPQARTRSRVLTPGGGAVGGPSSHSRRLPT